MKTLFISDLDGTLLNPEALVSRRSIKIINELLDDGMLFTCATARTASTALRLTRDLNLQLPLILMNGSAVYDRSRKVYQNVASIAAAAVQEIFSLLRERSCPAFVYSIKNEHLQCFAPPFLNPGMKAFRQRREREYGKVFTDIKAYDELASDKIIYFTFIGGQHELLPVYDVLRRREDVNALFYQDIYSENWFLELSRPGVSKGTAALYLKEQAEADYLCVFGDNLNDLPLFEAADFCMATSNAHPALREKADCIIGSNAEDAVALTLKSIHETGFMNDVRLFET